MREVNAACVNESEVRLMNQFNRVEGALNWRAPQPAVGQLAQPVVHEGDELIAGAFVPRAPSLQENCHL